MSPCRNGPAPVLKLSGTNATPYGFTSPFFGTVDTLLTGLGRNASSASRGWATQTPVATVVSATTISALANALPQPYLWPRQNARASAPHWTKDSQTLIWHLPGYSISARDAATFPQQADESLVRRIGSKVFNVSFDCHSIVASHYGLGIVPTRRTNRRPAPHKTRRECGRPNAESVDKQHANTRPQSQANRPRSPA
jgi:hypothetical protein